MQPISPLILLGGTGMIIVALGFLIYAAVRRLPASYLALGALAWVVTVAVKFVWAIPINPPLYRAITAALPGLAGTLVMCLYVGSLTGFTEVLLSWVALRFTRLGQVPWPKALAFGVGFGAVEALLLGLSTLASILLSAQPASTLTTLSNPLWGLAPIVERFFTCWIHIGSSVLLFLAATRRRSGWMWIAFWLKTLVDTAGAYGQLHGVDSLSFAWSLEAVVAVFGILGWLVTRRVQAMYGQPVEMPSEGTTSEALPSPAP
jgi:uncharacterized membrane protein YhfC